MRDEIFDRDYQAGRDALHDGIDRLIEGAESAEGAVSTPVRCTVEE